MSVSKWKYTPACDGDYCVGDCDLCNKEPDDLSFSLTLHSPMTKEDWAKIEDYEMESVPVVTFTTPSGKDVEFVKVIRCKDCKHFVKDTCLLFQGLTVPAQNDYCSYAERRESKVKRCFDVPKEVAEMLLSDTERRERE